MNELSTKPTIEITVEESEDDVQRASMAPSKENNVKDLQPSTKMQIKEKSRKKRMEKRMRYQPKSVLEIVDDSKYYEEFIDKEKGEKIDLPDKLIAMQYASGHAEELESMLNALKQHSGNKTPMQTLPFRLRRRATSINSKRLPRRLRDLAKLQNEGVRCQSGTALGFEPGHNETKVITRRKRRRNINLQNEYARRAGKQGWLETHLWHSKRFHMSSNAGHFADWDCKVPLRSYDKTFRTSCRAVAKHCAIQDLSFFKFVELCGTEAVLMKLLKSLVMDFELPRLSQLTRALNEVEFIFYDKRTTSYQCIGPVSVLFTPVDPSNDTQRFMWLWLHPTLLRKIMNILDNFKETSHIIINDISKTLNRFRLTGPKSSVTLMSVLRSYEIGQENDGKDSEKSDTDFWIKKHQDLVEKQHSIFVWTMKKCHDVHFSTDDTSRTPPCDHGQAYSLIVNDPRLTLPLVKTPSLISSMESTKHENIDALPQDGSSPIWKTSSRSKISSSRLPDHVVSTRKCEAKFLPEKEKREKITSLACPVPVVLVYRAGQSSSPSKRSVHSGPRKHFGSGWDILLPSNWALAFWIPFIYHQAKPVAMKNYYHSRLERKVPSFPHDFPDAEAGAHWWKYEREANHSNYYKKPPSKRSNYSVLGSRFPFAPDWGHLYSSETVPENVSENKPVIGSNVLVSEDLKPEPRNEHELKRHFDETNDEEPASKILKLHCDFSPLPVVIRDVRKLQDLFQIIQTISHDSLKALELFASNHVNHLVCVGLSPLSKGVPAPQTMICVPTPNDIEDLKAHFDNLLNKGLADCCGPVEPKHWDPYRQQRKEATKLAKKNRKRKKDKKIKLERNLPTTFGVTSSRKLIGFVTSGDFLFSFATGGGIGFVTLQSLVLLCQLKMDYEWLAKFLTDINHSNGLLCLMKNIDTDQYRFAMINLLNTANK